MIDGMIRSGTSIVSQDELGRSDTRKIYGLKKNEIARNAGQGFPVKYIDGSCRQGFTPMGMNADMLQRAAILP